MLGRFPPAAETAFAWLESHTLGVPAFEGGPPCPAATEAAIETAISYGADDLAARWRAWLLDNRSDDRTDDAIDQARARQCRDVSISDWPDGPLVSTDGMARQALVWLRRGDLARGGRALDFVAARRPRGWAAIWYLQAARLQVAASFAASGMPPLTDIDPRDGRWLAVEEMFSTLPPDAHVADVGCGAGRYMLRLRSRFPEMRLVGIDPAAAALASLPEEIPARVGDLLRLPAADGEFDAAVCVEALEHSLLPRRAVAELCRAVRTGGRLLIIDKDSARQPLARHEPWERWFTAEEVRGSLAEHCRETTSRHIPHGVPARDSRLFIAWMGKK